MGFYPEQYMIPATFPCSIVLFGNLVQAEGGFISAVVLNAQASRRSPWSTRGTARCDLFSILRRISPWFLQSLTAVRGNIEVGTGCFLISFHVAVWHVFSIVDIMEQ